MEFLLRCADNLAVSGKKTPAPFEERQAENGAGFEALCLQIIGPEALIR